MQQSDTCLRIVNNCYVDVNASFQLEKDNEQISVTAFAKVLSQFLDENTLKYKDKEEEFTEKQLPLGNVDFHLSQTGRLITSII